MESVACPGRWHAITVIGATHQDRVGSELTAPLRDDETAWLDAELG